MHARQFPGSAALVLGTSDEDLKAQLGNVFDKAGLVCERSGDVIGVEMAGAAKNAAVLAAAAADPTDSTRPASPLPVSGANASGVRRDARRRTRHLQRPRRRR